MKRSSFVFLAAFHYILAFAGGLPVITNQPQNQIVAPGGTIVQTVAATGATSYKWLCNGETIPGANTSILLITNAQPTNTGYYLAIARNATGWTPSQMSYVSVVAQPGYVPLCNLDPGYAVVDYQVSPFRQPITNGYARAVAGPTLDQMQPIGNPTDMLDDGFDDGCYCDSDQPVSTVGPGQTVFYRVDFTYPRTTYPYGTFTQPSRVLALTAGGGTNPTPSTIGLQYPIYIEWPDPTLEVQTPTTQVRNIGESFSLTNIWAGYNDFGIPAYQWRKDGTNIDTAFYFAHGDKYMTETICVFTITNAQPADTGIYDVVVLGNFWFVGPKVTLSVQTTNAQATLVYPRSDGSNFMCDLTGVPGLDYEIEFSSNLQDWSPIGSFPNFAGTTTFTNSMTPAGAGFYRAKLLQ